MANIMKKILIFFVFIVLIMTVNGTFAPTGDISVEGSADVTGNMTAANLYGNGSNITNLNATQLTSGTLPDTRLSANIMTTVATQTVTNKTITAASNNVAATSLKTTTGLLDVSAAAAPSTGKYLRASSGTAADWQVPATSETVSGTIESLTTTATQRVLVWATGDISQTLTAIRTVEVQYNAVRKDSITVSSPSDVTKYRFLLMYTEVPGAATNNITVKTSGGTLEAVSIMVLKLDR
jgi:hypothetical protein